jgi:hypothetical protein
MEKEFVALLDDDMYEYEVYEEGVYLNVFLEYWSRQCTVESTIVSEYWSELAQAMIDEIKREDFQVLYDYRITAELKRCQKYKYVNGPRVTMSQSCNGGYIEIYLHYTVTNGELVIGQIVENRASEFRPCGVSVSFKRR